MRKTGRPSKGDRDTIATRPARELGNLVRRSADESGMSVSDYVSTVLAEAMQRPDLAPPKAVPDHQEVLFQRTA